MSETDMNKITDRSSNANGAADELPKDEPKEARRTTRRDASKVEAPRTGVPKVEAPEAEAPRTGAPKVEAPEAEAPRTEPPHASSPRVAPSEGLRLRMKIWTDPTTSKRYLAPTAVMSDPRFGTMVVYAMSDEDTKIIRLTPIEWNALPFFYFKEDGAAPRGAPRPADALR